jgi:hypothetical protein
MQLPAQGDESASSCEIDLIYVHRIKRPAMLRKTPAIVNTPQRSPY